MSSPEYRNHPELAVAALLFMLARFPSVRCARMAASIERHLVHVAGDERLDPALREAAARIHAEWTAGGCTPEHGGLLH